MQTFRELAEVFDALERMTGRLEMRSALADALRRTSVDDLSAVIYLLQGKVAPDYEGIELNMGEKLAAQAVAAAAGTTPEEVARLAAQAGDLGTAAEEVIEQQGAPAAPPLLIRDVFQTLLDIARASGPGSQQRKIDLLAGLLRRATPLEARYLVRAVTGRLRLGVGDATVLEALAVACLGDVQERALLERAYNLTSDLAWVATVLAREGREALEHVRIQPGHPIRPMLAERAGSLEEVLARQGGQCAAEFKYDGERFQAHLYDNKAALYSRRLENITHQYPDLIQALREAIPHDVIVEGEAVAVDPLSGEMQPFQTVMHRKRKYVTSDILAQYPVAAFLFDILYLDGQSLLDQPYNVRRQTLERILKPHERVALAHKWDATSEAELSAIFEEAIAEGAEGLVCKDTRPDAVYEAGKRSWKWIKYKRDYHGELADTLDLVVVGGFYGKGRRAGTYGSLLLATYNPETDTFETITKCGAGFTDADLAAFTERLNALRLDHPHPRVRALLEPDIWVIPEVVIEVSAAEITFSPNHTCAFGLLRPDRGLSLRFPRFTGRVRDDKRPEDATTSAEVVEMYRRQRLVRETE